MINNLFFQVMYIFIRKRNNEALILAGDNDVRVNIRHKASPDKINVVLSGGINRPARIKFVNKIDFCLDCVLIFFFVSHRALQELLCQTTILS